MTDIIRKSQQRDPKTLENCKKNFLPEKYLETFLKVADNMSEPVMKNVTLSICAKLIGSNCRKTDDIESRASTSLFVAEDILEHFDRI